MTWPRFLAQWSSVAYPSMRMGVLLPLGGFCGFSYRSILCVKSVPSRPLRVLVWEALRGCDFRAIWVTQPRSKKEKMKKKLKTWCVNHIVVCMFLLVTINWSRHHTYCYPKMSMTSIKKEKHNSNNNRKWKEKSAKLAFSWTPTENSSEFQHLIGVACPEFVALLQLLKVKTEQILLQEQWQLS